MLLSKTIGLTSGMTTLRAELLKSVAANQKKMAVHPGWPYIRGPIKREAL